MGILEGPIVVREHPGGGLHVEQAPPRAHIPLADLTTNPAYRADGNQVHVADQVTYRIVGWDAMQSALIGDLAYDQRGRG